MFSPTDRQERIEWWRQDVVSSARIAVIGAGALGNEVLKNLALMGAGELHIFDMDHVEISNLSRTVLFRAEDAQGNRSKALIAMERTRQLQVNPKAIVTGRHLDVVWELGGGFFRKIDVVLGCLDNLEARLAIARHCFQFSVPYIDGGIRELDGRVQLHLTGSGACFDCTIGDGERKELEARYSCARVMRAHIESGFIPTVQVTSALIAAMMCGEAMKCLHHLPMSFGSALVWFGGPCEFDRLQMQRWPPCLTCSMPPMKPVHELGLGPHHTGRQLVDALPDGWSVLLPSPFLSRVICDLNGHRIDIGRPIHRCTESDLVCPIDGNDALISLEKVNSLGRATSPDLLDRSLNDLGIPAEAALYGQNGEESAMFVLTGDHLPT